MLPRVNFVLVKSILGYDWREAFESTFEGLVARVYFGPQLRYFSL